MSTESNYLGDELQDEEGGAGLPAQLRDPIGVLKRQLLLILICLIPLLIAAAIAQDAQAIFLDEPTTALDPAYQIELVRLLREWHTRGRALIVVSHDLQLPSALGGRIVAIRDGRIVADAGADELLDAEKLGSIYDAPMTVLNAPSGQRVVVPQWDAG